MSAATLGARVKAAREAAGLSMRGIDGVDNGLISRIESSKVTDPGIATMTAIAKATGKTVDELMGAPASAVRMVPLCDIEADPENPRTVDVANTVDAVFVDSIREHGLLQAVTVRHMPADHAGSAWRIAYGGRRYAALVLIHGPKAKVPVPALVTEAEGGDLLLKQLVENIARADMNPADLAQAVHKLVEAKMDTASLAAVLKKGRRWVQEQASVGRWLTLENMVALRKGGLNISQAVAIAAEHDPEQQNKLAAHAELQGLTEDEIRAIVADRKAKETREEVAADAAREPALLPAADAKAAAWPTPNENGVFECKATIAPRWVHKRGWMEIELYQYGEHKWCAGLDLGWRHSGFMGGAGPNDYKQQNAAVCFLDAARTAYGYMCDQAKERPEDLPSMHQLHDWVSTQLSKLGATERVKADWTKNTLRPEKPKAKPAPAPAKVKAEPKLPPIDITKAPTWAQPMAAALFVVRDERKALLCKGWRHMAKTFVDLGHSSDDVRGLYERSYWSDDDGGEPFDFGEEVVRLTDAPA